MGQLREREGAAPSSFDGQLEERDARLAQAISKDPYVFDFLGLGTEAAERDLEQAMMDRLVEVLRELGPGWAFVDRAEAHRGRRRRLLPRLFRLSDYPEHAQGAATVGSSRGVAGLSVVGITPIRP